MCAPVVTVWERPAPWEQTTRTCEGRLIVTNASTNCPTAELCDLAADEPYESYVRRHAVDHGIFIDATFVDIERNLFLWCFFAFHKYCLENAILTPWPFWEDHEFLANWDFDDDDLEMNVPKSKRTNRLPALPVRRPGTRKRQKKLEKPRETVKTGEGFAFATWHQLRAWNIDGNPNLRITVHSSTTKLTRKRYINQAAKVWGRKTGKLFEHFGGEEEFGPEPIQKRGAGMITAAKGSRAVSCVGGKLRTQASVGGTIEIDGIKATIDAVAGDGAMTLTSEWTGDDVINGETWSVAGRRSKRKIGLIRSRGAVDRVNNMIFMRWLQDDPFAWASHSMMGIGADSESTGERWDIYIGDDVCTRDNSKTFEMRQAVKEKIAEQEKQAEHHTSLWLWIDTRKHLDDVSGDIDKSPMRDYYQILHRKACWLCAECGEVVYYWAKDALGKPRLDEAYIAEQKRKHSERDFWNELMNEPQDPEKQVFKREWFKEVPLNRAVPLEVRCGLGLIGSDEASIKEYEEQLAQLEVEGARVFAINCGDPAGREKTSKRGDRTAIVGFRFDRQSGIWVCDLRSGQWSSVQQKEEAYASTVLNKPRVFIWEIVQDSGVDKAWLDFMAEKSAAIGRPVMMPMKFVKPKRVLSKQQRIEELEPYFRRGVHILDTAGTALERELFVSQFLGYLIEDHDDYPDAAANVLDYLKTLPAAKQETKEKAPITESENGHPLVAMGPMLAKMMQPRAQKWGRNGGAR